MISNRPVNTYEPMLVIKHLLKLAIRNKAIKNGLLKYPNDIYYCLQSYYFDVIKNSSVINLDLLWTQVISL